MTTINLTIVKGGVQDNVIPAEMRAVVDMRISVNTDLDEFEKQVYNVRFLYLWLYFVLIISRLHS